MPKTILIHSLIFSPDGVSTAYLYNDIAIALKNNGYQVKVLTTTPHFNLVPSQLAKQPMRWKVWGFCKVSTYNGIRVYHIPQKKFKSTVLRLIGFAYWHVVSFIAALCIGKVDFILSPSPPLTIGVMNIILGKIKRCKVVYNVQEIYPDILNLKKGIVFSFLSRLEHYVYNNSSAVTTIDKVFYDTIVDRFADKSKLRIIPNFVDTDLYRPIDSFSLDKTVFPINERIKVLYAGNIGYAQDWDTLIKLVDATRNISVDYVVIGEGVMKQFLEDKKKERHLDNLYILPYQPREKMPEILAYSDIQFIFMTKEMDGQGFPSKVYTVMSCARPLLISSSSNTPIVNFLKEHGCAKIVTDDDMGERVRQMKEWLGAVNREELRTMGEKGRKVVEEKYSRKVVTGEYVGVVGKLMNY